MKKKIKKPKKYKTSLKEKFALAVFMESVPKILELWKNSGANIPLDEWLLDIYLNGKENKDERSS